MVIKELEAVSSNNFLYNETTSRQKFIFEYKLSFDTDETYRNYDEAIEALINHYLKEKGIDETVQTLIYDKFPDINI